MSRSESNPANGKDSVLAGLVGVLPLFQTGDYHALKTGQWDPEHIGVLRTHAELADVVYTRWRDEEGREFPFSPYDRAAHLGGLNFVGTDVSMSERAFGIYSRCVGNVEDCLRTLAEYDDISFLAVDAVTYTRRKPNAG